VKTDQREKTRAEIEARVAARFKEQEKSE